MDYRPEDAQIALDIVAHSPSIALRMARDDSPGGWKTLFLTDNISAYGYSRQDFLDGRLRWADIVHEDDRPALLHKIEANAEAGVDRYVCHYRIVGRDGIAVWVADSTTVVRDEAGGILYTDRIVSDHSEIMQNRRQAEDNLEQQRVLNEMLQTIHLVDLEDAFRHILSRTGEFLGISRILLFEDNFDHTESKAVYEWCAEGVPCLSGAGGQVVNYRRDLPEVELLLNGGGMHILEADNTATKWRALPGREPNTSSALFSVYQGGEKYGFIAFDECVRPRRWDRGTVAFLSNVARLVGTALLRRSSEASMQHMAYHDQLTGLINRYRFDAMLELAIARARREGGHGYVLFIDMDDFKVINEGYGHDYGDALLVAVADHLKDNYSESAHLFRFGGDEFTLLVEQASEGGVQDIIDGLITRARHPWKVMDREFYCTVSVGVVRFPDGGASPTEVTKNADIAMYKAKNMGKNSYFLYNTGIDNESVQRAETEHKMREAIENEFAGFRVYYQPIVDMNGGITGAEALIRWADAAGNLTPPGKFIPLAEYLGLIVPLGEFVLREAALFCARMNESLPDFTVNINISIRQFQQHDFLAKVEKTLTAAGVDFSNIVLEVTEGMMIQDVEHMQMMAEQLRGMGLRIAMDDFGTGYSSLNNMRTLPLDIIKIDRSFIRDVTCDAYSKSFIHLITDLVHSMGRDVCVEGVETAAQYRYCAECGVDSIQGFYFYKPMPATQLRRLMVEEKKQSG